MQRVVFMNKKTFCIILVLLSVFTVGILFAVDNCKYYSTHPSPNSLYSRGGLRASLSGSNITVDSTINERVKITSVTIDGSVVYYTGTRIIEAFGDTTLIVTSKIAIVKGQTPKVVIQAETCD